ncbi:sphingomyelin phosphodiesterase [Litoribacillus peritrichatus]|uniref:Sphingomyelin phosphodiesterase n=1 Tax=Litoribacillus peritrichatus TaxID=718191 RepID=A0ABP7MNL8_9GAMM
MALRQALFVLVFLFSPFVSAESYIYLTNNTMETLTLQTRQTGHTNITHGNEWQQLATEVPPLGTVKFLRFNRDQGIKWGKDYYFTTTVSGNDQQATLRQKLQGTMTFSKMWLSAEEDPWYYDREIHNIRLSDEGAGTELAFKSEVARVSGDDIRYVIHKNWQQEASADYSNQLKVLNYNTWILLPGIIAKNSSARLDTIAEYVKGYDVVVFEEVFDPVLTAKFRSALRDEYPFQTDIPWKFGKILNGGSFIASRWPIVEQDSQVYDACRKDGCLAAKGINYAKIMKGSNAFHIFGTHTHAYTSEADIAVRFQHLAQFKAMVDSKQIPEIEPVIMAGDFNVDKVNYPAEHQEFLTLLNGTEPEAIGEYEFSYAGPVNVYADDEYNEYLDYVLYSNEHMAPFYSTNKLLVPRSISSEHWGSWDLSDHYPVVGEFEFPLPSEYVGD